MKFGSRQRNWRPSMLPLTTTPIRLVFLVVLLAATTSFAETTHTHNTHSKSEDTLVNSTSTIDSRMSNAGASNSNASPSAAQRLTGGKSTTLPGREKSPLDADKYPVAPEGLELAQVQVFVRHGAP